MTSKSWCIIIAPAGDRIRQTYFKLEKKRERCIVNQMLFGVK